MGRHVIAVRGCGSIPLFLARTYPAIGCILPPPRLALSPVFFSVAPCFCWKHGARSRSHYSTVYLAWQYPQLQKSRMLHICCLGKGESLQRGRGPSTTEGPPSIQSPSILGLRNPCCSTHTASNAARPNAPLYPLVGPPRAKQPPRGGCCAP